MRTRPVFVSGLVLALVIIGWLLATGVGLAAALLVTAALALQTVTGGFIWARVRRRSGGSASSLEILAVGFALGSFLAMAAGVLLRPVVPGGFGWAAPSVVVLGVYLISLRNRGERGADTNPAGKLAACLRAIFWSGIGCARSACTRSQQQRHNALTRVPVAKRVGGGGHLFVGSAVIQPAVCGRNYGRCFRAHQQRHARLHGFRALGYAAQHKHRHTQARQIGRAHV